MSRWEVYKAGRYGWAAGSEGEPPKEVFRTWREALAYADKRSRTVAVPLPRAVYGERTIADKGIYSLRVDHREHCTGITLGGWDGAHIPNSQLWDLAMYLAACATHWEETQ